MSKRHIAALSLLILALLWSYWPTLGDLARRWGHDPRYAHGFLVPVFSLYLLRTRLAGWPAEPRPSWWGLALLVLGPVLRFAGSRLANEWLEAFSLLMVLAGLALLFWGREGLRRSAAPIAFLLFMIPLPYRLEVALSVPLQRMAAEASTFALQTVGIPALADGTAIRLLASDGALEVGRACSGLSMLVLFFALCTGAALTGAHRFSDKAFLILSAIPIALVANVARITLTGILHEKVGGRLSTSLGHDLAGWLMIPMALAVLWLELRVLALLWIESEASPLPLVGPLNASGKVRPQHATTG